MTTSGQSNICSTSSKAAKPEQVRFNTLSNNSAALSAAVSESPAEAPEARRAETMAACAAAYPPFAPDTGSPLTTSSSRPMSFSSWWRSTSPTQSRSGRPRKRAAGRPSKRCWYSARAVAFAGKLKSSRSRALGAASGPKTSSAGKPSQPPSPSPCSGGFMGPWTMDATNAALSNCCVSASTSASCKLAAMSWSVFWAAKKTPGSTFADVPPRPFCKAERSSSSPGVALALAPEGAGMLRASSNSAKSAFRSAKERHGQMESGSSASASSSWGGSSSSMLSMPTTSTD
mmetsp:Transcript_108625/g.338696  ORF Transcript_108625/g.338696 Transcript_108625/m.338696 type:complete len:288 (-) Transcript_108625:11-874(-)